MGTTLIEIPDLTITSPHHPDHEALMGFLGEHMVETEWLVIPSVVKVTNAGVTVTQYLHNDDGSVRMIKTEGGYDAARAQVLYQTSGRPEVPRFSMLEVSGDGRR